MCVYVSMRALLITILICSTSFAADLTVRIEEPAQSFGPIGDWYIGNEVRKHELLYYTRRATLQAEWLREAREEQRRYLADPDKDMWITPTGERHDHGRRHNLMMLGFKVSNAERDLKFALEGIERNNGKKKPKNKSQKEEDVALRQALGKLN